jgi:hypothetical protein
MVSVLAHVECQLVIRFLDIRARLAAARCNKRLFEAANHSFAWPQEQMATLRVENDPAALQSLGARVRGSLLRLSAVHLRISVPNLTLAVLSPEVFAEPNVQAITVQATPLMQRSSPQFLLQLLRHPSAAQQLRSLDFSRLWKYRCSPAELQGLQALPDLRSLGLPHAGHFDFVGVLRQLAQCPALVHLSINLPLQDQQLLLYPSFALFARLTSLRLADAIVSTPFVHCLAQLPLLQCLQLSRGSVGEQSAQAWTALRSLRELQLDDVHEANGLLAVLTSVSALRSLRWRCRAPRAAEPSAILPALEPLRQLVTAAPLLQVELLMPRRFDEWRDKSTDTEAEALMTYRRRCWDELQQLPNQLFRARIIERESDDQ